MEDRIRAFLIDDSLLFRSLMIQLLGNDTKITVVGAAGSVKEARGQVARCSPDALVVNVTSVSPSDVKTVGYANLLSIPVVLVGAQAQPPAEWLRVSTELRYVKKPPLGDKAALHRFCEELLARMKPLAGAHHAEYKTAEEPVMRQPALGLHHFDGVVAIGASTGGTQATSRILRALPADFPGIVIVQHMPPNFTRMYADSLDKECALAIREARDGDAVLPGQVLIAPGDEHMRLNHRNGGGYSVSCVRGMKVGGHCPSVNELFASVAQNAGRHAIGVILTGMGADGALGLTEMRAQGAYTIGQDESTCTVYGMPREAFLMGGVVCQAPLDQIPGLLVKRIKASC